MAVNEAKRHGYIPVPMQEFVKMTPEQRIRAILANKAPEDQRFTSLFIEEQCELRDVKIFTPKHALITFAFKVDRYYCNGSGNLHGGAQV